MTFINFNIGNIMKKLFKLRGIKAGINCTFSLSGKNKKPTKQQAKTFLLEEGWWLDDFSFRDSLDVLNGANFSVHFRNLYFMDNDGEIEINTPIWEEEYNCYTLKDISRHNIVLKNIKIENVEDVYCESLDTDHQYPYETHIDFMCSIHIEFEDSQMDHQVVTREMCYE
jgi:hypothetical protein